MTRPSESRTCCTADPTPEEAAEVLGMVVRQVYAAAFRGELKANIVGQDVVSVERADLLEWLRTRP